MLILLAGLTINNKLVGIMVINDMSATSGYAICHDTFKQNTFS